MPRPMVLLTIDIAILDKLARLACLETDYTSCNAAAVGTAVGRIMRIVHACSILSKHTPEEL